MKKKISVLLAFLVIASLLLAACGGAEPTEAPEPTEEATAEETEPPAEEPVETEAPTEVVMGEEATLKIGFTSSVTGSQEVASGRQTRGFNLWMEAINAAGGIVLSDGTVVKLEAVTYDAESNTDRVQELYTILATEDEADLLISPYSSGLTAAASVIAEQYGKVMITTGAASDSTYKEGYTLVFQAYTPASRYLTGAVDLLAHVDPNAKKVAFVHEN